MNADLPLQTFARLIEDVKELVAQGDARAAAECISTRRHLLKNVSWEEVNATGTVTTFLGLATSEKVRPLDSLCIIHKDALR